MILLMKINAKNVQLIAAHVHQVLFAQVVLQNISFITKHANK